MKDINRARILRVQSIMGPLDIDVDGPHISEFTTLEEALKAFGNLSVDQAIIVDQGGEKIGTLTIDQLIRAMKRPEIKEIKVGIQAD